MELEFRRFQQENYPEYAAWFVDAELNRRLGPMDQDWLDAVLAMTEDEGVIWAVFRDELLVAVIEITFELQRPQRASITGLATKPQLRRQGIGTAVLTHLLALHQRQGIREHWTHLRFDNAAALCSIEKMGFQPITGLADKHGYIEFLRTE